MLDADTLDRGECASDPSDRRRTGRRGVALSLLPLLRESAGSIARADDDVFDKWAPREPIAPPRGIALALALCTPIWIGLGGLIYAFIF